MQALGRLYDIVAGAAPVSLEAASGTTGNRVHMKNCGGVTVVAFVGAAASGTDALTFTVREHDAASSGNSADLDTVTKKYTKLEATLDGDETWTATDQTAGDVAIAAGDRDKQGIVVFDVDASELSDGKEWLSVDISDPTVARLGCVLYILHDLHVQRAPENLANPQA